jgi:hypothetical protein
MKNVLELNIGLLRNTDNQPNSVGYINTLIDSNFGKHKFRLVNGVGDWGSEETYVASIKLDSSNLVLINLLLEYLCMDLKQDAIAYIIDEVGYMAFNPSYEGERYEFNINYFERFAE